MPSKQEWTDQMIAAGAGDPTKGDHRVNTAYPGSYLERFEIIDIAWAFKLDNSPMEELEAKYDKCSKARNQFAREMRKDGWVIKCSSYTNIWDQKVFKLEGERPRQTGIQQMTLASIEA